jgi:hypothetical protein
MTRKNSGVGWPAPRFPGKTFVLESTVSGAEGLTRFIEEEGGRVVPTVTASLDYLLTGPRRGNKKTPEKKRAEELNRKGASIEFLDEQEFFARLLPTRDEALLLIGAGEKGRERWGVLWNHWNDARTTLDLNGLDREPPGRRLGRDQVRPAHPLAGRVPAAGGSGVEGEGPRPAEPVGQRGFPPAWVADRV